MARCACLAGRAVLVALVAAMAAFPAPGQDEGSLLSAPGDVTTTEPGVVGEAPAVPAESDATAGEPAPPEADGEDAAEAAPARPETPPVDVRNQAPPLVTLDQDRFFRNSAFGKAALARAEAAATALSVENRRIEGELESEERTLTEKRATLPPKEFTALAQAFDAKVERIRKEQDEKSRDIGQSLDGDRARFFEAAGPVLAEMLGQIGALAILSDTAVILSLGAIDVTDEAILRIDAAVGADGVPAAPEAPITP